MSHISPPSGSLRVIIRLYKATVTKRIRTLTQDDRPVWQPQYHDHIIRNEQGSGTIRQYVCINPSRWAQDVFAQP